MHYFALLFLLLLSCPNEATYTEELNLDDLVEIQPSGTPPAIIEEKISPIENNEEQESHGIFDLLFGSINKDDTESELKNEIEEIKQDGKHNLESFSSGDFYNTGLLKTIDRNI